MPSSVPPFESPAPHRSDAVFAVAVTVILVALMMISQMATAVAGRGDRRGRLSLGGRPLHHTLPTASPEGGFAPTDHVACLVATVPIASLLMHSVPQVAQTAIRAWADENDTAMLSRSSVVVQKEFRSPATQDLVQAFSHGGLAAGHPNTVDSERRQDNAVDLDVGFGTGNQANTHTMGDDG